MDCNDYISLVLYYGRSSFYNSMQKAALDGLAKFPMQSEFRLFNGIALALGNRMQECIRELNPLKNDVQLGLAATMTLIYAHKHCRLIDFDAVHALESRTSEERNDHDSAGSYYFAAVFLYFVGDFSNALDYVAKSITSDNSSSDAALILKVWCELALSADGQTLPGKIQAQLEGCIQRNGGKNIDASLALVRFYQKSQQFESSHQILNKLSTRYPDISIPLVQKMEMQFAALDLDHSLDTAIRVINMEPFNMSALRTKAVLHMVHESDLKSGTSTLQQLLSSIEGIEPANYKLLLETCQLFSRICTRNVQTLQLTQEYIEKVNEQNPGNVDLITELGYQKLLQDKVADAEISFRSACNVDSTNFNALCGLTLCKLKSTSDVDNRQQIRQQLAYLTKLSDYRPEPMIAYMTAYLADSNEEHLTLVQSLAEAVGLHIRKLDLYPYGVDYICQLNPDLMLEICTVLIRYTPTPNQEADSELDFHHDQSQHATLKHSLNVLETILHVCPGHKGAMLMRAKVEYLRGEYSKAIGRLQHILNIFGETCTEAHLLMAQILVGKSQFSNAFDYLEQALTHDFTVREQPMYHLLKGIVLKHQGNLNEAHQSLVLALQLVGGLLTSSHKSQDSMQSERSLNSSDKMTLYIELIFILRDIGDSQGIYESQRILQVAIEEFSGSTEMGRLIIAHSQLMIEKCNFTKAISLLSAINPDESYYIMARKRLANIYLHHQKNRSAFSGCFKGLTEVQPGPKSFLMLGDAYLSIQETVLGISAYQKAIDMCPSNVLLVKRLGRVYVKSHHYSTALKYYLEMIQSPECSALKLDLAELLLKLKHFQKAINVLTETDKNKTNSESLSDMQLKTKQLLLLARVYEKSGNIFQSMKSLEQARDNQLLMQKLYTKNQSENVYEQSKMLSRIYLLIAQHAVYMKNNEMAITNFRECYKYTPNDLEILVSLAKLQMKSKEMEMCRNTCMQILQMDTNNEAASVMMADLSFKKMDFKNAAYHFSQLLVSQPYNWTALARFIEVMRRSGTLSESVPYLHNATKTSLQSKNTSGLNYCNGLFEWYNGNLNNALRYFNLSRRDHIWGQQAKLNMIEICINPDSEIPNANNILDTGDELDLSESRLIALRTAERLIKEISPRPGEFHDNFVIRRILWNFLQMASKQKYQIESALKDFTELIHTDSGTLMVAAAYGAANALVQLKQVQRAKNHLKRIAQIDWTYEEAEYLERSWLLLADIYISVNKLDVAENFVSRVLKYNKSCTKAYELAGYIAEKLQSYNAAAKHYEDAWKSCGHSRPHIGYKVALNNMKLKQYTDAIKVSQEVLKLHPYYTIIRSNILEKCRFNIRD